MHHSEEETHVFGKTKQASRKTENDERSYEQVKSIKMVGQGQLSAKKCTLEWLSRGDEVLGRREQGIWGRNIRRDMQRENKIVKGAQNWKVNI